MADSRLTGFTIGLGSAHCVEQSIVGSCPSCEAGLAVILISGAYAARLLPVQVGWVFNASLWHNWYDSLHTAVLWLSSFGVLHA